MRVGVHLYKHVQRVSLSFSLTGARFCGNPIAETCYKQPIKEMRASIILPLF
jgi:hypothetical protein